MKRLVFLFSLFVSLGISAQTVTSLSSLWLNDVPGVIDEVSGEIFFTVKKQQVSALSGTFRFDDSKYANVMLNGVAISNNTEGNFSISDWHLSGANKLTVSGKEYSLVFTTLPIIVLNARQETLYNQWKEDSDEKQPSDMLLIDANKRTYQSVDDIPGESVITFPHKIGIRVRGATSAGKRKKPFAIELQDDLGNEVNAHLLGMRNDGDWILDAMFNDRARMRNKLILGLWKELDKLPYAVDNEWQSNATDGEYVEVFMIGDTKQLQWWGVYHLTDKIDRKKLNLKKAQGEGTDNPVNRGLLWKSLFNCSATTFSSYSDQQTTGKLLWSEYTKSDGNIQKTWEQHYPDSIASQGDFTPIAEMIDCLGRNADDQTFADNLTKKFYIDNVINYHIFTQAFQLQDNLQKNMYLSVRNVQKSKQLLITLWDVDASLGRNAGGDELIDNSNWFAFGGQLGSINYLLSRLKNKDVTIGTDSTYHKVFYDRWQELKKGALSIDNIRKLMNEYAAQLVDCGAWAREYKLWKIGNNSTSIKMDEDVQTEIDFVCKFLQNNYAKFDEAIASWGGATPGGNPGDNPGDNPGQGDDDNPSASGISGISSTQIFADNVAAGSTPTLRVSLLSGERVYFVLAKAPEISFNGEEMLISADEGSKTWGISKVDSWQFVSTNLTAPTSIDMPFTLGHTSEKKCYTLDGVEVNPSSLKAGVYIMKSGNTTIRFVKK